MQNEQEKVAYYTIKKQKNINHYVAGGEKCHK